MRTFEQSLRRNGIKVQHERSRLLGLCHTHLMVEVSRTWCLLITCKTPGSRTVANCDRWWLPGDFKEVQNLAKTRLRRTISDHSQPVLGMKRVITPKNSSDLGHFILTSRR